MGALSNLAKPKPSGSSAGALAKLAVRKPPVTATPSNPLSYFVGNGYSYASSTDPYSGKPILKVPSTIPATYQTPATTISVQDQRRVATTFDPTKAQPVTREMLANGRMPESASQALRTALGAGYNEELDHQIALTLSGANTSENLKLIASGANSKAGGVEGSLANKVIKGEISLLDAQLQDAAQKGIRLPESKPTLIERVRNSALKSADIMQGGTVNTLASLQEDPLTLKGSLSDAWKTLQDVPDTAGKQLAQAAADYVVANTRQGATLGGKIGALGSLLAASAGVVFSPISALFASAEKVPVLGSVAKLVGLGFSMPTDVANVVIQGAVDALPISQSEKEKLAPGLKAIADIAVQIGVGEGAAKVTGIIKGKAKTVVDSVKAEAPELAPKVDSIPQKTVDTLIAKHGVEDAKVIVREAARAVVEKPKIRLYAEKPAGVVGTELKPTDIKPMEAKPTDVNVINTENTVTKAFAKSTDQTKTGNFELGSFGKNAIERKATQTDRFPISELKTTQEHITDAYRASSDPNNYRKDNIAWVSDMPNGEKRVIYTRQNASGAEEIINAHVVSDPKFIETLRTFGAPNQNRTGIISLERKGPNPLNDRGNVSIAQTGENTILIQTTKGVGGKVNAEITAPPKPVETTNDQFKSRVFERMQAENPESLTGDLTVNRANLKEQASKAVDLIESDKQKAYRIAMGAETSSEVLSSSVNIAMAEKALADGNISLYSRLVRNRSLEQTRRGQEIVAERGSISDNSTSRYVKELLASRLEALGKKYLGDLSNKLKRTTDKGKAMKIMDKEVAKVEAQIKGKKLDVKSALALLEKLTCV